MDYNNKQCNLLIGWIILILLVNCAGAATLNVPGTYTTIQAAINAASAGDTILVQSGTYNEHVVVNKQLTLQGVGSPVVNAGLNGNAITLSANGCTLNGFVANNAGSSYSGIKVTSNNNIISSNSVTGSINGIHLESCIGNKVTDNIATANYCGIDLYFASGRQLPARHLLIFLQQQQHHLPQHI